MRPLNAAGEERGTGGLALIGGCARAGMGGTAKARMTKPDPDVKCLDWFMCLKKCPKI